MKTRTSLIIHCGGTLGMVRGKNGFTTKKKHLGKMLMENKKLNTNKCICRSEMSMEMYDNLYNIDFNTDIIDESQDYKNLEHSISDILEKYKNFTRCEYCDKTFLFKTENDIFYHLFELDYIIDSSNANLKDWVKVIDIIEKYFDDYKSFIIIHGTDTLAYAASFFSFAIQNLTKPIVLTGAMNPMIVSDEAIANIWDALECDKIGVYVTFGGDLHVGCRMTKASSIKENAFLSWKDNDEQLELIEISNSDTKGDDKDEVKILKEEDNNIKKEENMLIKEENNDNAKKDLNDNIIGKGDCNGIFKEEENNKIKKENNNIKKENINLKKENNNIKNENNNFKKENNSIEKEEKINKNILQEKGYDIIKEDNEITEFQIKNIKKRKYNEKPTFYKKFEHRISIIKIFPNISSYFIKTVLQSSRGIVLETYGSGNGLSGNEKILKILKKYIDSGGIIINISQCLDGYVNHNYESNILLSNTGVISGKNLTTESAFCKLAHVLGNYYEEDTKEILETNLCGEYINKY